MEDKTTSTEPSIGQPKIVLGVLQAIEAVFSAVILGLTAYYIPINEGFLASPQQTFLFMVSFSSLMVSFLLFISSMIDISYSLAYSKSIFLPLYLLLTLPLYCTSSIALLIYVAVDSKYHKIYGFDGLLAASILGLVNSILYLVSLVISIRAYIKGLKSPLP